MATIDSVWDLRPSSSPRSISVYPSPTSGSSGSSTSGGGSAAASSSRGGSTNPFASSTSLLAHSTSGSNPFDDAAASSSPVPRNRGGAEFGAASSSSGGSGSGSGGIVTVIVGTERGALHRRTYGGLSDAATTTVKGGMMGSSSSGGIGSAASSSSKSGSLRPEQPLGSDGSSSSSSSSSVPSLHKPIDLANAAVGGDTGGGGAGAAIVSLVQTKPLSLQGFASPSHSLTSAAAANASPVFLMLADDNRVGGASTGGGSGALGIGGAYAAQLVTINAKGNKFDQLGDVTNGHSGGGSSKNQPTLPPLSRASCAAYHPSSGYVYAAGTSVMSLPPKHALAVAHHLVGLDSADGSGSGSGGGDGFGVSSGSSKRGGLLSSVPSYRSGGGHLHGSGGSTTTRRQEQQLVLLRSALPRVVFDAKSILPSSLGARSGPDALCVTCDGRVAVVAVGNGFFAVSGRAVTEEYFLRGTVYAAPDERHRHPSHYHSGDAAAGTDLSHDLSSSRRTPPPTKILSFAASGRVHPAVVVEIPLRSSALSSTTKTVGTSDAATSLLFLASGRECAAVEILHDPRFISSSYGISMAYSDDTGDISSSHQGPVTAAPPRHGVATVPSPILSAVGIGGHSSDPPLVAMLMSDGLVQTRSPSCLGVPLTTVEVGNRPNDFFTLRLLPDRKIVSASYSGEGRVLSLRPESPQDLADRLMTLAVDAFGPATFPRTELAEAISASYGATSYAGHSEPTVAARALLRQYLEAILSLDEGFGDESSGGSQKDTVGDSSTLTAPAVLLTGTALLCKVCMILSRPNTSLANRAARSCSTKMGVGGQNSNEAAVKVCNAIAEDLLAMASAEPSSGMSFIEPASWLLRSCGLHEKAIEVVEKYMNDADGRNKSAGGASGTAGSAGYTSPQTAKKSGSGAWSQLRFESFLSSYLSDLWASGNDELASIVLESKTTLQLLEQNARLAVTIFTSANPQSEKQWEKTVASSDPLAHPSNPRRVIDLLKSARPSLLREASKVGARNDKGEEGSAPLPLTSGRALAVTYLESAVGISTGRQASSGNVGEEEAFEALPSDKATDERIADLHDELAFLLLEGVIAERQDIDESSNTYDESDLGALYRGKLRRFLSWPAAKVRPERLLSTLSPDFKRERALCLGRLGRHGEALRILYGDLRSLDMALEYCDARYEHLEARKKGGRIKSATTTADPHDTDESENDPYLPLVKVALASGDKEEGVDAAVKVLSLRRDVMDCGTALRLLPRDLPMSRIARPFLIPAVVDDGAEVRQMKILAALLRARYIRLKKELTEAQIESQSNLYSVPALKALGLGDLVRSAKPFRARSVHATSSSFPDVTIIKHFFPRYLIIQAKITNSAISSISGEGRALADVSFVVAESSDEALTPTLTVPLKTLPTRSTGSVWCALAASPQRLDDVAVIACELRYTVLNVDATTGAPLSFGGGAVSVGLGHTYVEELQDLDVRPSDFEYR